MVDCRARPALHVRWADPRDETHLSLLANRDAYGRVIHLFGDSISRGWALGTFPDIASDEVKASKAWAIARFQMDPFTPTASARTSGDSVFASLMAQAAGIPVRATTSFTSVFARAEQAQTRAAIEQLLVLCLDQSTMAAQ